jgi:hypothetical protein
VADDLPPEEPAEEGPMFDLVLRGGSVVDGTGAPAYRADVGVGCETIAAIGDLAQADASRVTDAAGLVVAPGFIDPHTHAEGALLTDPQHPMGLRQGITTEFLGIDGMSYAPLSPANYRPYRRWLAGLLGEPPEDLDTSSVARVSARRGSSRSGGGRAICRADRGFATASPPALNAEAGDATLQ